MISNEKAEGSDPADAGTIIGMTFVIFFCPIAAIVMALDKSVGFLVPPSNPADVARADSLRATPNCKCGGRCNCNAGANISNAPDQL